MTTASPYADIELFLRVVERGSIRAAAREAGVEPSSVSRRLTRLERRLGTKLVDRSQASSRPTAAGARYYEQTRVLLAQIQAVEADVSGEAERPKGLLKVNAPIDFGQRHVARWLLALRRRHPEVDIQLTLASGFVDLVTEGVDVVIRVGRLRDSALKARKLADVPRVLVASADYLRRRGTPETPGDLVDHEHVFFAPGNRLQALVLTGPDGAVHRVERRGGVTINAVYAVVEAVRQGCGIHAGPRWAFQEALDRGEVVEILADYTQPAMPMNALWSPAVLVPARIRSFLDYAVSEVRKIGGLTVPG